MTLRLFTLGHALVLALCSCLWLPARLAAAQTADGSCQAVEQTEAMRAAGRYREARARLLECVNAQCGGDVRRRCASTLQKLDAVTPSVVVRAEDENGNDVTDVHVDIGDVPLVRSLDGMAIPVDPGKHRFVFRRIGYEPVVQTLTIREGQKFRPIDVRFQTDPPHLPPLGAERAGTGALSTERIAAGASLIGVGVAGLAGFAWLGLEARSGEEDLDVCSPRCSEERVESVRTRYILSNVSLGVGVLALGGAAWVLLSGSSPNDVAQPADGGIAIAAGTQGALASFSGSF